MEQKAESSVIRGDRKYQMIAVATEIPKGEQHDHAGEWVSWVTVSWTSPNELGTAKAFGPYYGKTAADSNNAALKDGQREIDENPQFEGSA